MAENPIQNADALAKAAIDLLDVIYENPLRIGSALADLKPSGNVAPEDLAKITALAREIEKYAELHGLTLEEIRGFS